MNEITLADLITALLPSWPLRLARKQEAATPAARIGAPKESEAVNPEEGEVEDDAPVSLRVPVGPGKPGERKVLPGKAPQKGAKLSAEAQLHLEEFTRPGANPPRLFAGPGGLRFRGRYLLPGEPIPENELKYLSPADHQKLMNDPEYSTWDPELAAHWYQNRLFAGEALDWDEQKRQYLKKVERAKDKKRQPPGELFGYREVGDTDPALLGQQIQDPAAGKLPPKYADVRPKWESPKSRKGRQRRGSDLPELELPDEIASQLNPDELGELSWKKARRLVQLFNRMPSEEELAAMARSGSVKRGWYAESAKALASIFTPTELPRFVALLAGTSPRVPVKQNLVKALKLWIEWKKFVKNRAARGLPYLRYNKRDMKVVGRWLKDLRATADPRDPKGRGILDAFSGHDRLIASALLHPDPGSPHFDVLHGLVPVKSNVQEAMKVDSFRRNLLKQLQHLTNDVWMAVAGRVAQEVFGGPEGYLAFNAKMRRVKDLLNSQRKRGEQPWTEAEIQETIWSFTRALALFQGTHRKKTGRTVHPLKALQQLTKGDVADTVDFLSLMLRDQEVRGLMKEAGYAKQLKNLDRIYKDYRWVSRRQAKQPAVAPGDQALLASVGQGAVAREAAMKQSGARRDKKQLARRGQLLRLLLREALYGETTTW
jgi:hypothetical protein